MMDLNVPPEAEPTAAELIAARPALSMHAMDGLCFEYVPLHAIADAVGTPAWVYGAATLRARHAAFTSALSALALDFELRYAVKANGHLAILNILRQLGAGADVVSFGEFLRARAAGIAPEAVVFSGVGKTRDELARAISGGVGHFNVESAEELDMLAALAEGMGRKVKAALRMNPDVDAGTHEKITTGRADNKFGIPAQDIPFLYARAALLEGIQVTGLAMHIGSQINSAVPFARAFRKAATMVAALRGIGQTVTTLDIGGGLGIGYGAEPGLDPAVYANLAHRELGGLGLKLIVEPGRYLVGPAGLLLASVVREKRVGEKRFVVLDAAMNDLIRPAMYEAWHGIIPIGAAACVAQTTPADIVGPVCETADCFGLDRALPDLAEGARVAILDAGAYGEVMSSTYNARPRAAAVLVEGGAFHVITPRQDVADLWAREIIPG